MGCGSSRPEEDDMLPPLGLGPIRRKIEEIRKRRNGGQINGSTLSKKELLKEGSEEEGSPTDSIHNICREMSLSKENPNPNPSSSSDQKLESDDKVGEKEEGEDEDEKREGFGEDVVGFGDLPGSPSFREYYLNPVHDSDEIGGSEGDEGKKSEEDRRNESQESLSSDEGSLKAKSKKGRRFRVLAKGSIAVYSLLKVRGCYKAAPSKDNPRLLCEKDACCYMEPPQRAAPLIGQP
ncbi:uncharacterized protein LOC143890883 [Tasmannia lanceolata]|uniref:uncharacterized protein LOC143890883 n=1 Tax=Tasmannia lanceolata TaxID=3420 RepID=UPI00406385D0